MRRFQLLLLSFLVACGGGGGESTVQNTQQSTLSAATNELALTVERWSGNSAFPNQLYTTIQVCLPATQTCQSIDHVLVDTGSFGLRLFDSTLSFALPVTTQGAGDLYECARFVSGYIWGSVNSADVVLGGIKATMPIQVSRVGSQAPSPCAQSSKRISRTADLGANGILGVGSFIADCGLACQNSAGNGMYYNCQNVTCTSTTVPVGSQVSNPVAMLPSDNNGVVIDLTGVQSAAAKASGSMFLGIGTRSNNDMLGRQVLPLDANGYFVTIYKGKTFRSSYVDSGSNALFFQDNGIHICTSGSFFCPGSPTVLSATMSSGLFSLAQSFTVSDPLNDLAVLPELAGTGGSVSFVWGLPFFYGKRVFTGFEQRSAAGYNGSFVAF